MVKVLTAYCHSLITAARRGLYIYSEDVLNNVLEENTLNYVPSLLEIFSARCYEEIIVPREKKAKKEKSYRNGIQKVSHSTFIDMEKKITSNVRLTQ
ncbi:hypothetical protein NPIL_63621 [Nephila pilipes]|uniref:Uncharacterized protein n=1 Tax=Nephila pilipes TaxID=299642 RepID=A0A8X6P1N9_NEPPI|nr:hypothetical protein NPIL_63621 [Nephila pilipes]